jgi:hypothetical protein
VNGSSIAPVDFGSTVFIGRAKRDIGLSFVSVLATDREHYDGQGHNRVVGPDFQFRRGQADVFSGQWLFSDTVTPNHPELTSEWNGQSLTGHATQAQWSHGTKHLDWYTQYRDATSGFRADTGFVPQVGFREIYVGPGWTVRPKNFVLSRIRTFLNLDRQTDLSGTLIGSNIEPGIGMDTKWSGFAQVRFPTNEVRTSTGQLFTRHQFAYYAQISPSRAIVQLESDGSTGSDVDFANSRPAYSTSINFSANLRPTNHLELALIQNTQWLNEDDAARVREQLFVSYVSRLKSTYNFTAKLYLRAIGQYASTNRTVSLYTSSVDPKSGDFSGSLLLAYKLNWQSVLFLGYGDDRELTQPPAPPGLLPPGRQLAPLDRQVFVKVSYAFQK